MSGLADRAGVLVVRDDCVALIARRRGPDHYFVAPGGGVDPGEAVAAAAVREAREELGLGVELIGSPHTVAAPGEPRPRQHYWFAESDSEEFGEMSGPEQSSATNTYVRMWVPIGRLDEIDLRPAALVELIRTRRPGVRRR